MQKLIAILSMLVDCLRLFMIIELQICKHQINIIIYSKHENICDYEIFKWNNENEKAEVIKLAIHWLLQQAITAFSERGVYEESTKDLISKRG